LAQPENQLISSLPRKNRQQLLSLCQSVPLVAGDSLAQGQAPTRHAYFPISGLISLVVPVDDHPALEVGMVGSEGMLGTHTVLGVANDPLAALVGAAGAAWRIGVPELQAEWAQSAPLQYTLGHYNAVLLSQLATASGCLHYHQIGPRLARWLLMTQDRAHSDHFHVTHEFLARMLGVRRVGITAAASALQREGLVGYHRGELSILDRPGLEHASCSCYQVHRQVYIAGMK
jgi:CRP-like cAMP-binding protein